jgi:hypothetical protein
MADMPPIVGRYAAYLRARTGHGAEIAVSGETALITASRGGAELRLVFASGKPEWQMTGIEVTRGGQAASFAQGQLGAAIAALLSPAVPAERQPG